MARASSSRVRLEVRGRRAHPSCGRTGARAQEGGKAEGASRLSRTGPSSRPPGNAAHFPSEMGASLATCLRLPHGAHLLADCVGSSRVDPQTGERLQVGDQPFNLPASPPSCCIVRCVLEHEPVGILGHVESVTRRREQRPDAAWARTRLAGSLARRCPRRRSSFSAALAGRRRPGRAGVCGLRRGGLRRSLR